MILTAEEWAAKAGMEDASQDKPPIHNFRRSEMADCYILGYLWELETRSLRQNNGVLTANELREIWITNTTEVDSNDIA